jgi:hypothetical protein
MCVGVVMRYCPLAPVGRIICHFAPLVLGAWVLGCCPPAPVGRIICQLCSGSTGSPGARVLPSCSCGPQHSPTLPWYFWEPGRHGTALLLLWAASFVNFAKVLLGARAPWYCPLLLWAASFANFAQVLLGARAPWNRPPALLDLPATLQDV